MAVSAGAASLPPALVGAWCQGERQAGLWFTKLCSSSSSSHCVWPAQTQPLSSQAGPGTELTRSPDTSPRLLGKAAQPHWLLPAMLRCMPQCFLRTPQCFLRMPQFPPHASVFSVHPTVSSSCLSFLRTPHSFLRMPHSVSSIRLSFLCTPQFPPSASVSSIHLQFACFAQMTANRTLAGVDRARVSKYF